MFFQNYINEQNSQMNIGNRLYKIINLVPANACIRSEVVVERAIKMGASLNQYEAFYLKEHRDEIPKDFRMKVDFAFADWRKIKISDFYVYSFAWDICLQRWWGHWNVCGPWVCNELYTLIRLK